MRMVDSEYKAQIFVPTVARFPDDLSSRHALLRPAREQGFRTGLMVVLLRPEDLGIAEVGDDQSLKERRQKQLDNLDVFVNLPQDARPGITVMHPWRPLLGEKRLNFLTNPDWSEEYVGRAIDFTAEIPDLLTPVEGRYLSFHTNTMITPDMWVNDLDHWEKQFEDVQRRITNLALYGANLKAPVKLGVETIPIPAFGDWSRSDDSHIEGTPFHFADLIEPYPLLPHQAQINKIRKAGAHITHDWSHTFIAMSSVKEVARLVSLGLIDAMDAYRIYKKDLEHAEDVDCFDEAILNITLDGDMVHANNASGIYRFPKYHGGDIESPYKDSAPLSEGDIPLNQLTRLIQESLRKRVYLVLELNEPEGKMLEAPNTKEFLDYVLKVV